MPVRITGLNSGLDTEAIVSELVKAYSTKKNKYVKAQTKLSWKQDAWKGINSKIHSLYSNISNLRFSTAYAMKKTTVSDATKCSVTAAGNAVDGTQTLKIKQLAKAGYVTGGKLGSNVTADTKLSELGFAESEGTITVQTAKGSKDISVKGDMKVSDFINKLNESGLKASFDAGNKRIFVSAGGTGVENDFSLIGSNQNGLSALSALGLNVNATANTNTYSEFAAYAKNENGDDYFVKDAAGNLTYDEDGKAITNGTYSQEKTRETIAATVSTLSSAYAAKNSAEAENKKLESVMAYEKAYKAVNDLRTGDKADKVQEYEEYVKKYENEDGEKIILEDGRKLYSREEVKNPDGTTTYQYLYDDENGRPRLYKSDEKYATISERKKELAKEAGLITTTTKDGKEVEDESALTAFNNNKKLVSNYETNDVNASSVSETHAQYEAGTLGDAIAEKEAKIADNKEVITTQNATIASNSYWDVKDYSKGVDSITDSIMEKISLAAGVIDGSTTLDTNATATRVNGQDAVIELNGAEFTSSSNSITVNGLTINATNVTKGDEEITITTATDKQGLYDKVKDFITKYNELINEINSLYNADSAKGYEPLTDEEKEKMSDSEVEKWEAKIKSSLLRRDNTLGSVMNVMTTAMSKTYDVNGKKMSLSMLGISTKGYMGATKGEQYAYHIAGDPDDVDVSSSKDKLMAMLETDPDSVVDFMKQLTGGLYDALGKKMQSTSISSAYTVYNDKEMASEYSDYTNTIKKWEDKVSAMEDSYYKKFSKMESALAKLQNSTSSLSSLFGNNN